MDSGYSKEEVDLLEENNELLLDETCELRREIQKLEKLLEDYKNLVAILLDELNQS